MARVGYLDHSPDVVVRDGHRVLYRGQLAVNTDAVAVGFAKPAPPVTAVPSGYRIVATRRGQGGQQEPVPLPATIDIPAGTRFRVFARCVGRGRLVVFWTGEEPPVPCDGAVHESPEYTAGPVVLLAGMADKDPYATWSYVVAVRS